jgi:hypothetical protein
MCCLTAPKVAASFSQLNSDYYYYPTLLRFLARRTALGFPRKPAGEGVMRMIRSKAAPLRLDPLSYENCASTSCVAIAGRVNPAAQWKPFVIIIIIIIPAKLFLPNFPPNLPWRLLRAS